jgi:DNA-directed RNA polymerase specialized sigma24 family protein
MAGRLSGASKQLVGRLRLSLLGGSVAVSRDLTSTKATVTDLHTRFLERIDDLTASWQDLGELFITHEASLIKLRAAVGCLMGSAARDDANRAEVCAEAGLCVLRGFKRHRALRFRDGVGSFDSWLYSVWKRAVQHAIRRQNRGLKLLFVGHEVLECESSPNRRSVEAEEMLTIKEVWDAVAEMPAGSVRNIMLDWASGLSGADSARLRCCSEAWVSILRGRGVALVRKRLGVTPPVADLD